MSQDTSTASGKHAAELTVAERVHQQLVQIVADETPAEAYHDIWDLYPELRSEQVWSFVVELDALLVKAAGWDSLPGAEALANRDDALKLADVLVAEFLRVADGAAADAQYPPDPFEVEAWNERLS